MCKYIGIYYVIIILIYEVYMSWKFKLVVLFICCLLFGYLFVFGLYRIIGLKLVIFSIRYLYVLNVNL